MDATGFMADRIQLPNTAIPHDFFNTMTTCTKECKGCRICSVLFDEIADIQPVNLNTFKDIQ